MATKMTSLKYTAAEKKQMMAPSAGPTVSSGPEYPYGLRFSLDEASLNKLGNPKLELGKEYDVNVRVRIESLSVSESATSKTARAEMCIVAAQMEPEDGADTMAEKMYGGEKVEAT